MTALLTLVLLAAGSPQVPDVASPPLPDFSTRVDYLAWYREQLKFADADNAYEDYRLFVEGGWQPDLPDELHRNMTSHLLYPRRWHTGQEPRLTGWLGGLPLAFQAYADGARRRYFAHGLVGQPSTLLDLDLPGVLIGRLLSEATLVESWRLDAGLSPDDWLNRLLMVNRFANHLSQGATLFEQLTAMSVKNRVYSQIAFMMKDAALDDGQLRKLLSALQQEDGRPASLMLLRALPMEEASAFELLQRQCLDEQGQIQAVFSKRPEAIELWNLLASGAGITLPPSELDDTDPCVLAAGVREYLQAAAALIRNGESRGLPSGLARLRQDYSARNKVLSLLIPNLERAVRTVLRTELTRRGTQVLVALSIRRRENLAWPESLAATAGLVPEAMLIDLCSGQPLVYSKTGTRMKLYSIGQDGLDNGGFQQGMRYAGLVGEDLQIYPPVVKNPGEASRDGNVLAE